MKFGSVKEEYEVAYKTLYEESSVLLSNCQQLFKILGLHMAEIVLRKESDFDDDIDEAKLAVTLGMTKTKRISMKTLSVWLPKILMMTM